MGNAIPESGDIETADSDDEDDNCVDYSRMPNEPRQLDDWEFEAYTELREWRLHRKQNGIGLTRYARIAPMRTGAKETE